jgi:hypothetical protein
VTKLEQFEALLFQGTLTAFRTLTLDELIDHRSGLLDMDLPEEIAAFPIAVLDTAIAEKQTQRAMN